MLLKTLSCLIAYYITIVPVLSSIQSNVPLCPQKHSNEYDYPYVVYGKDPARCYVASRQGPCSEGNILFAQPNSHFGVCSCECFLGEGIIFNSTSVNEYRYCFSQSRGSVFVFDKKRQDCYQLGSQGPCQTGQVLHKDIYEHNPKCVSAGREDMTDQPHTPIEEDKCPPGTIYSTLLNECTDMSFTGLPPTSTTADPTASTTNSPTGATCPPGTIYSTLLNICTDMSFTGLPPTSSPNNPVTERPSGACPPGTIYSTLLNICTDMSFTGLPPSSNPSSTTGRPSSGATCPPGTIYSTLLNICTDMSFTGLPPSSNPSSTTARPTSGATCPPGTIYSTLLNICTDMSFTGLPPSSSTPNPSTGRPSGATCPPGTIYSTLLNKCTDMSFTGLPPTSRPCNHSITTTSRPSSGATCPPGTIYSTLLNICTDMNFKGLSTSSSSATSTNSRKCPPGTIYSTLLNLCTDMSFRGLKNNSLKELYFECMQNCETQFQRFTSTNRRPIQRGTCPPDTIYSTLLNKCVDIYFRGLPSNYLSFPKHTQTNNKGHPHSFQVNYLGCIEKCQLNRGL